jgi:hypothetical protein
MTPSSGRVARTLLPAVLLVTACSFHGSVTAAQSRTSGTTGSAAASSTGASTGSGTAGGTGPPAGGSSLAISGSVGTTAPAGSTVPRTDRCHTSELTGSLVAESSGAGQRYATLVLRNTGGRTCTVHGYGGLGLAGSDGRALPTTQVRTGGPATTATLAPGASVSSSLHWSAVPGPGDAPSGPCQPDPATLRVIPPDETDALSVAWRLGPACSAGTVEQHPYAR